MNRLHPQTALASLLIYLVPYFGFLSSKNLPQISNLELLHFSVFIISLFFFVTLMIFIFVKIVKKTISKINEIYLACFVSFYSLFLIKPFFDFFLKLNLLDDNVLILTILIITFYNISLLVGIFRSLNLFIFLRRFFLIFSSLLIINSITNLFKDEITFANKDFVSEERDLEFKSTTFSDKKNIYFIIMDEMISLDLAEHYGILVIQDVLKEFRKLNLNYIPDTISSYSGTHYTITSILEVDQILNKEKKIKTEKLYPAILNQKKIAVPLVDFLSNKNYNFYFVGNYAHTCNEFIEQNWKCISKTNYRNAQKLFKVIYYYFSFNLLEIFDYRSFIKKFFKNYDIFFEGGQRNLDFFLNQIKKKPEIIDTKNSFFLIHQLSPHTPYTVDENCNQVSYKRFGGKLYEEVYEGYKASYECVLLEIDKFMKYIKTHDPNSVVVIQGDHGISLSDRAELIFDTKLFRAKIFNAIYSPEECRSSLSSSNTTINSIRFALNCVFDSNFEYLKKTHSYITDDGVEIINY